MHITLVPMRMLFCRLLFYPFGLSYNFPITPFCGHGQKLFRKYYLSFTFLSIHCSSVLFDYLEEKAAKHHENGCLIVER